jgi:hypothetical protein
LLPVGGDDGIGATLGELSASLRTLSGKLAGRGQGASPSPSDEVLNLAGLLAMALDWFACEGQLLEIRVPWLGVTLWFVPDERGADALGREGVRRGRVWTAMELMALMALRCRTPPTVQSLAHAKYTIDRDLVDV